MAPITAISPALNRENANKLVAAENLKGRNALVTGGASGIGLAIATAYAQKGAYVTLVDKNVANGKARAQDLQRRNLKVQFVEADVTSWQSQQKAFKDAVEFHPNQTLDIVVAGAGTFSEPYMTSGDKPIMSLDEVLPEPPTDAWLVNAIGLGFTAKLAHLFFDYNPNNLPSTGTKSLLVIASLAAYFDIPMMAAYTSSKYGARGMFRSLRPIFARSGHRVNLMAPWIIPTPMTVEWTKMFEAAGAPQGDIEQAVRAALRCASDDQVNGRAFCIGPIQVLDLQDDLDGCNAGLVMRDYIANDVEGWPEQEKKMLAMMGFDQAAAQ